MVASGGVTENAPGLWDTILGRQSCKISRSCRNSAAQTKPPSFNHGGIISLLPHGGTKYYLHRPWFNEDLLSRLLNLDVDSFIVVVGWIMTKWKLFREAQTEVGVPLGVGLLLKQPAHSPPTHAAAVFDVKSCRVLSAHSRLVGWCATPCDKTRRRSPRNIRPVWLIQFNSKFLLARRGNNASCRKG
jgi:hypothetical protein